MITRQSLRVRANGYVRATRWLAILILLGGLLMPLGRSDASAAAPQDYFACRTLSSLNAVGIFSTIGYTPLPGLLREAAVRLVLRPQHRMFCASAVACPGNPNTFTLDTVRYRVNLSTNIASAVPFAPDPTNFACPLQANVITFNTSQGSVLRVKLYFQENFSTSGINPKRQVFDLQLPARGFVGVADGTEMDLLEAGFQIFVVDDPNDPDGY